MNAEMVFERRFFLLSEDLRAFLLVRERSHLTLTSLYFLAMMRAFQNGTSAKYAESLSIQPSHKMN